jgi:hypothetical protein
MICERTIHHKGITYMSGEMNELPEHSETMARLEAAKHTRSDGVEYWRAREMQPILGYLNWREFEGVWGERGRH